MNKLGGATKSELEKIDLKITEVENYIFDNKNYNYITIYKKIDKKYIEVFENEMKSVFVENTDPCHSISISLNGNLNKIICEPKTRIDIENAKISSIEIDLVSFTADIVIGGIYSEN